VEALIGTWTMGVVDQLIKLAIVAKQSPAVAGVWSFLRRHCSGALRGGPNGGSDRPRCELSGDENAV
jgi:hypothetical protein